MFDNDNNRQLADLSSSELANEETPLIKRQQAEAIPPTPASNDLILAIAIAQNVVRDFIWAALTAKGTDINLQPTDSVLAQTAAQFVYSLIGTLAVTIGAGAACKAANYEVPAKDSFASLVATLAALGPWNAAQYWTNVLGLALGLTPLGAAFLSGVATGALEGPIQFISATVVKKLIEKLSDPEERAKFLENPKEYLSTLFDKPTLIEFGKGLAYSFFPGKIPGDVWQFAYAGFSVTEVSKRPIAGPLLYGTIVSTSVGVCNVLYAKADEHKLLGRACDAVGTAASSAYTSALTKLGIFKQPVLIDPDNIEEEWVRSLLADESKKSFEHTPEDEPTLQSISAFEENIVVTPRHI
ncbi:MAG TPA: hypothetical protein VGV92_07495 [Gammaproteobacteria bacterium]|nr:hypothetical protein [Gammaproteobacteria bacterium]